MPANISWRKLVKRFKILGFKGPYSGGRHLFMVKKALKVHIPSDHGKDISVGLVNEILKQAGISKKCWDNI